MKVELTRRTFIGGLAALAAPKLKALVDVSDPIEGAATEFTPRGLILGDTLTIFPDDGGPWTVTAPCSVVFFGAVRHRSGRWSFQDSKGTLWPAEQNIAPRGLLQSFKRSAGVVRRG